MPWLLPQCLQNQSSDIRLVTERVLWWVFKEAETPTLEPNLVKPVIKALLDNTKDKNTSVRAQSEHTLVSILRLRQGESGMQVCQASFLVHFSSCLNFGTFLPHCGRNRLKCNSAVSSPFVPVHFFQSISVILDSASNELLSDCYRRSLKKISGLPDSNEEIDDTILT